MDKYKRFNNLVDKLIQQYDLIAEQEHENIITFFNEVHDPLFKIVTLIEEDKHKEQELYIMYHLDVTPTEAIIWFNKIRLIDDRVNLAENWIIVDGDVITGLEAEFIHSQKSGIQETKLDEKELEELDRKAHVSVKSAYNALKVIKAKGKGNGH